MTRGNQRDNNRERNFKKTHGAGAPKHEGDQTQIMEDQKSIMREKQRLADEKRKQEEAK
ncbi:Conserved_hypothetical protein [Hexamita inflata]|uniref:Small EDRK-rich factor-like N-terminal domain-containing protein n=1 Tax=Hexamita inflata TaxID=28002 RepID=A0AA86PGN0_9EUKA|nr:Conserved hypothetical protein [Hexamita inflata]CAI9964933.1 Conserved hypothetical protein [Hexamita inflata]